MGDYTSGRTRYDITKIAFGAIGSLSCVSTDSPLPVSITGGSSSGGLSDAELRASPVPVSVGTVPVTGAFYPVTQPVSIASMPTTAVTGTFWPATQPVSGTVAVSGSVAVTGAFYQATQPVSIASMPSTPVTGTFWQATQPVSGTVTANINGTVPVSGTFWQATQPVSGTFWQATQPVSLAATVAVRELKDNARSIVNAATAIAGVTAVTTEALLTLAVSRDGAGTSNATTIAVTSGKKLRIIGITAGVISTSAAVISARVCLRMNPSGAVAANSPILAILPLSQQAAALAQAGDTCVLMFSEAIELSGTMQCGLSQLASATSGTVWASLIAYEY